MLLTALMVVFHEVLEAAFLIALLLTMAQSHTPSSRWLPQSLALGILAAFGFQAVMQAALTAQQGMTLGWVQILTTLLMVAILVFLGRSFTAQRARSFETFLKSSVVVCLVAQEGAELILFIGSFLDQPGLAGTVLLGSAMGLCLGVSVGIITYHVFHGLSPRIKERCLSICLAFYTAGLMIHGLQQIHQSGLFLPDQALWDSGGLLSEQSVWGLIAVALFHYEATPTLDQVVAWGGILCLWVLLRQRKSPTQA